MTEAFDNYFTTQQILDGELDPDNVPPDQIQAGYEWWGEKKYIDSKNRFCTITNKGVQRKWQTTFQNFDIGPEEDNNLA